MNLSLAQDSLQTLINGILNNESWTRVLLLGVVLYGVIQIREIKRTMVTQDSLKSMLLEMEKEIREWTEGRFLSKDEHATICRAVNTDIDNINHRLDRRHKD